MSAGHRGHTSVTPVFSWMVRWLPITQQRNPSTSLWINAVTSPPAWSSNPEITRARRALLHELNITAGIMYTRCKHVWLKGLSFDSGHLFKAFPLRLHKRTPWGGGKNPWNTGLWYNHLPSHDVIKRIPLTVCLGTMWLDPDLFFL